MRVRFPLLLASGVLALTGCDAVMGNPTFMPAGYTYHGDYYKAAPGPEAKNLGYVYTSEKNEEILQLWHAVVSDLVDQLEDQTGFSPGAVYIGKPDVVNAFNATYDDVLREELISRGYTVTRIPGEVPHLRYEAFQPEPAKDQPAPTGELQDFVLVLTIFDQDVLDQIEKDDKSAAILGQVSGVYELPHYGYHAESLPVKLLGPIVGGQP